MSATSDAIRILVSQHGARHRYAIPRMLHEAGMLERFYTDASAHSPLGRFFGLLPKPLLTHRGSQLVARRVVGVPPGKIHSTDAVLWSDLKHSFKPATHPFLDYQRQHQVLFRTMTKWGVGKANWVYVMYDEGLDWMRFAKAQGLHCAVDVYIHPGTGRIVADEQRRFPGFEALAAHDQLIEARESYVAKSLQLADMLTCPSEWVAEGVRKLVPEAAAKIRIVPYGSSLKPSAATNRPIPGRVLFAGNAFLRKGLHYLGMAASALRSAGRDYDFRVAGQAGPDVMKHPYSRDLNFLGKLSSEQLEAEFASADLFVLPTLSEGFASVIVEAMSAGLPVITTPCAGSAITHERDGIIVPPRDGKRFAMAIENVVENRAYRKSLGVAAAEFAQRQYDHKAWKARLQRVFETAANVS